MNEPSSSVDDGPPLLAIDLDGSLIRGDLSGESLLLYLRGNPLRLLRVLAWLPRGRAYAKRQLARRVTVDHTSLQLQQPVLEFVRAEHQRGRGTVLASGSDELLVRPLAEHLGCFDDVLGSDGSINMTGPRKASALVARSGDRGFEYLGNSKVDVPVWQAARAVHLVSSSLRFTRFVQSRFTVDKLFQRQLNPLSVWLRQCRVAQWLKNVLLFVSLILVHAYDDVQALAATGIAFLSFSLCASGIYLLNDLVDLPLDRRHPRKCRRPLANGDVQVAAVCLVLLLLLLASALLALLLPPMFQLVLLLYAVTAVSYSALLRRLAIVDVLVLAGLYTLRIVAGGAALALPLTFWLLAFSLFLFLSLALMKRYTELKEWEADRLPDAGRGYRSGDGNFLIAPGFAAGFTAVLVLALYLNGAAVQQFYRYPEVLWLVCPVLLFWISHIWFSSFRGRMLDDPIMFAVQDATSLLCAVTVLLLFVAAV